MQDNLNYKNELEEAFLEESWAKMSAMLDKDIPVGASATETTNNGSAKYALLFLLCLLFGGGTWWMQKESGTLEKGTKQEKEIIYADKLNSEDSKKEAVPQQIEQKTTEEINYPVQELRTKETASPDNLSLEKSKRKSNKQFATEAKRTKIISDYSLSSHLAQDSNRANSLEKENGFKNNKTTEAPILDSKLEPTLSTKDRSTLASLDLPSNRLSVFEKSPLEVKKLIKINKPLHKWKYGFIAGVQQEKFDQGFGGFSIGVLANRTLAKHFAFEAGLNFSLTQFNRTILNNSPSAIAFDQPELDNTSGIEEVFTLTYNPTDVTPVDPIQLGSASWLSLPILLTYQPTRKWRISMGVEYAQLLNAKQQKVFDDKNYDRETITDLIAGNNISALTGITWFPRKNLGIDIRYQFGFTDLSKSNSNYLDQTHTRAALQWALVYYFNPKK